MSAERPRVMHLRATLLDFLALARTAKRMGYQHNRRRAVAEAMKLRAEIHQIKAEEREAIAWLKGKHE